MKKIGLVLLAAMVLLAYAVSSARAGHLSTKTHIYATEYLRPASLSERDLHFGTIEPHPGIKDPHILNLLLMVEVNSQTAESLLRSELARITIFFPPEGDILAAAWVRLTDDPADENLIYFPDGSCHLVYSKKENKVLTSKEHLGIQQE